MTSEHLWELAALFCVGLMTVRFICYLLDREDAKDAALREANRDDR